MGCPHVGNRPFQQQIRNLPCLSLGGNEEVKVTGTWNLLWDWENERMKRMEIQVVYIYMHGGEKGAKSNKARKTKLVLKGVAICFVRASQLLL